MKNVLWMAMIAAVGVASGGVASAAGEPSVDEQIAGLVQMCAQSEEARVARQAAEPLYVRLGESGGVHRMTTEVVRLHSVNPDFGRFWGDIDEERLIKNLDDFIATGTGGPKGYEGRDMPSAHAHLELSKADFLSAGGDVVKGMENLGYGEEEIQEFVCILVSMKDLVITR
ncbi:MAG: group 1 truncated hemoglobin [Thermoanaerobaculales bacterium]|jgi:hemoglobin|nr:group 1 truncated hemoglobin [Thermoanaerobaculales bacterium]